MSNLSETQTSLSIGERVELRRLLPAAGRSAEPQSISCHRDVPSRLGIFQLNARFESAGVWAGVDQLVEMAYLGLLKMGQDAVIEEHQLELYMVLHQYRDRIRPKTLCLTDTAPADERTRVYAVDRAYRLVHGLVGMILQWKRAHGDRNRWVVVVRNFDHAQHLAARFFAELARRAAPEGQIDVIIETGRDWSDGARRLPGMKVVPAAQGIAELRPDPAAPDNLNEDEIPLLEGQATDDSLESLSERQCFKLFNHYRSKGNGLAAARMALEMLIIYKNYGYHHEAKSFVNAILPYFDQLVGNDEFKRLSYVGKINLCLALTDDPAGALRVVDELAAPHITKPPLLASMNYILAMHYLRYAETKDIELAEQHILRAVDYACKAAGDPESSRQNQFRKVFIDNGLAFLRVRQGRHQEAIDLCQSGYRFLTSKLGSDRHLLHQSVLQYNTAQVYVMMGRLEEGLEYYRRAISIDPNYMEYHNEVANILQEQGRYQEAIEHYLLAIKCSAPFPEVYFNKAVCHARREESEDALICFQISLELNPDQPVAHALRADLLREMGRVDEALEGYDVAIALGYEATAVRVNRAVLHYDNGSYELALLDMNEVIAREGHEAAHYENRAAIYRAMNRQDLFLGDLRAAERYRDAG